MQIEARQVYVTDDLRSVQCGKLHPQSFGVARLDSSRASRFEEPSEAFVFDRVDHRANVACCATLRNAEPPHPIILLT